jgi:hypothetical protein
MAETLKELEDEWNVWLEPTYINSHNQTKKTVAEIWREANPGEYTKLLAYRDQSNPVKPILLTSMGRQMVEHVEAWLTEKNETTLPPPQQTNSITQTIKEGVTLSGVVDWRAVYDAGDDGTEDDPGSVKFYVDGSLVRTELDIPFGSEPGSGFWDSSVTPNGTHTFKVEAVDLNGEVLVSNSVVATVNNVIVVPPPITDALFDGRATRMTSLTGSTVKISDSNWSGGSNPSQSPVIWGEDPSDPGSGLYFMTDSIKLISDPKYGKVYLCEIGPGDTNPYYDQPTKPNGELTKLRSLSMGQIDWYSEAFKIISPYTVMGFNVICQYGYPSLASPPLSISFDSSGVGIDRHVGILIAKSNLTGPGTFIEKPRFWSVSTVLDKWIEMLIGVKWNVDSTGWVVVYARIPELGETQFTKKFEHYNTPTWQQIQGESLKSSGNDKMGLYFGTSSTPPTNRVAHRGIMRFNNETSARASFV